MQGYQTYRSECPSNLKKDKYMLCFSDTDSESESDGQELLNNFVVLVGQDAMFDHCFSSDSNYDSKR